MFCRIDFATGHWSEDAAIKCFLANWSMNRQHCFVETQRQSMCRAVLCSRYAHTGPFTINKLGGGTRDPEKSKDYTSRGHLRRRYSAIFVAGEALRHDAVCIDRRSPALFQRPLSCLVDFSVRRGRPVWPSPSSLGCASHLAGPLCRVKSAQPPGPHNSSMQRSTSVTPYRFQLRVFAPPPPESAFFTLESKCSRYFT